MNDDEAANKDNDGSAPKPEVKRVQPFPIEASVGVGGGQAAAGYIVKLTTLGFLIDMGKVPLQVGQSFQVTFTLPVHKKTVQVGCLVIKTYDRARDSGKSKGEAYRLAEMHFKNLLPNYLEYIENFLAEIKGLH